MGFSVRQLGNRDHSVLDSPLDCLGAGLGDVEFDEGTGVEENDHRRSSITTRLGQPARSCLWVLFDPADEEVRMAVAGVTPRRQRALEKIKLTCDSRSDSIMTPKRVDHRAVERRRTSTASAATRSARSTRPTAESVGITISERVSTVGPPVLGSRLGAADSLMPFPSPS